MDAEPLKWQINAMQEHPEWSDVGRDPRYPSGWWILPALAIAGLIVAAFLLVGCSDIRADAGSIVRADMGGNVGEYLRRVEYLRESKQPVQILSACYSACTLLATLPYDQVCVGPHAELGFHASFGGTENAIANANTVMMIKYPPPLRAWIEQRGGLSDQMIYLSGEELSAMFRRCA